MTQTEMILRYMQENGSITQAEAVSEFGCYRLGARIFDLKAAGHQITKEIITSRNRFGHSVSFAKYNLEV